MSLSKRMKTGLKKKKKEDSSVGWGIPLEGYGGQHLQSTLKSTHRQLFASMNSSLTLASAFKRTSNVFSSKCCKSSHPWGTHLHRVSTAVWEGELRMAEKGWKATSQALLLGKLQTKTLKTTFVWSLISLLEIFQFNPQSSQSNIRTHSLHPSGRWSDLVEHQAFLSGSESNPEGA